jgi:pimeloyl-ACP methyl ester carboxylesterase
MRRLFQALLTNHALQPALAGELSSEPWRQLPPTPAPVPTDRRGQADANGISIHYAIYGHGSPVILLHGGLANSDYWGHQVGALVDTHHAVVLMDSRGHGRTTRDSKAYGYDLMTDDVVALMDYLKIEKADVVGWSDGAIIGLDLAMRHKDRVGKIFAFGANTVPTGIKDDVERNSTFATFIGRAGREYAAQSATPKDFAGFVGEISKMWAAQPNWTDAQLKTIDKPVLIVDGEHDEAIKPEHNTYMAETIPNARLVILPKTSHFAFMQDPELFNAVLLKFLDEK